MVRNSDCDKDFEQLSNTELERSITRLCADINAATYRQLIMLAEFDKRQAWGDDAVRSCAHWLNWRCGVSLVAAREKMRVAHALQQLPNTSKAFADGKLSYSKARAITRVATIHNEDCLLSYARYGTASQLDKTVRLYRRQFNSVGEPMVDYHQPELPADENTTPTELSDKDCQDAENQHAMHNIDYRQLSSHWDEHGCLVIRARLTAEQGALVLKAMDCAVESIKQAEPDTHTLEAAKLANQQHTRRRADALVLMADALLKDTKVASRTDDRYQVVVHVDSQVLAKEHTQKPDGSPDCYINNQVGIPVETARRLSCSCKIVTALTNKSEPLSIGRSSRAIPVAIRRALDIRDKRCVFPGCDCHTHLDAHHIIHWANNGHTSLSNLILVCHHHHTLLHEGQYSVERLDDGKLLFKRPDGQVLNHEPLQEIAHEAENLPISDRTPWSWNGDVMDYDHALLALASGTRHAMRINNESVTKNWNE